MFKLKNKNLTTILRICILIALSLHYLAIITIPSPLKTIYAAITIFVLVWQYFFIIVAIVGMMMDKYVHENGAWYFGVLEKRVRTLKKRNVYYLNGISDTLLGLVVCIVIYKASYDLLAVVLIIQFALATVFSVIALIITKKMYVCGERADILTLKDSNKYLNEMRDEYLAINDLLILDGAFDTKEGLKEVKAVSKYYHEYLDGR